MTCPACGAQSTRVFYTRHEVPVHSCLLLDDEEEARRFPTGDLKLALCEGCGFVFNQAYDPTTSHYSQQYEETQAFSPLFRTFLRQLARDWVHRYQLRGKRVVEIGCGKAEFAVELARQGVGEVVGVDPGVHPDRIPDDIRDRVSVVQGFFPQDFDDLDADAVVCRHTLEHIGPVADFMRDVRLAIGDRADTVVLFELPDALRVLREAAFWDIYYEHCSYFTLGSLARLFRWTGFEVVGESMAYEDQYLLIEARPKATAAPLVRPLEQSSGRPPAAGPKQAEDVVAKAARQFRAIEADLVQTWSDRIEAVRGHGRQIALWGSGSKGVAFLAALDGAAAAVGCVVDINPHKHGKFMAGSGHPIVEPDRLKQMDPELVLAMNPVYLDEIRRDLDEIGVRARLEALV